MIRSTAKYIRMAPTTHMLEMLIRAPTISTSQFTIDHKSRKSDHAKAHLPARYHPKLNLVVGGRADKRNASNESSKLAKSVNMCAESVMTAKLCAKAPPAKYKYKSVIKIKRM